MSLWKRPHLQDFYGSVQPLTYGDTIANISERPQMAWSSKLDAEAKITRIEDGFVRSGGLGAALVPPLSLVTDDLGIYYDPAVPSRIEKMIEARATPPSGSRTPRRAAN